MKKMILLAALFVSEISFGANFSQNQRNSERSCSIQTCAENDRGRQNREQCQWEQRTASGNYWLGLWKREGGQACVCWCDQSFDPAYQRNW